MYYERCLPCPWDFDAWQFLLETWQTSVAKMYVKFFPIPPEHYGIPGESPFFVTGCLAPLSKSLLEVQSFPAQSGVKSYIPNKGDAKRNATAINETILANLEHNLHLSLPSSPQQ